MEGNTVIRKYERLRIVKRFLSPPLEAAINAIWLEMQAKMTLLATMIGTPSPQSPEEVQLNIEQADPIAGRWKYYVSLLDLPYVSL
jgi:hypothetical protein